MKQSAAKESGFEVEASDRDAAVAAAVRMATETRKEAGCQSYAFYSDFEDAEPHSRVRGVGERRGARAPLPHAAHDRVPRRLGKIKISADHSVRYEVAR